MPTWSSADQFAAEIARFQQELERESRRSMAREMAEKAQRIAESEASHDLGGDPKFSGWAPALDTQVKMIRDGALIQPTRSGAGPWTVAEQGRNVGETGLFLGPGMTRTGGTIRRRADGSVARQRGRKAKRWNGVTRGKGTASRAVDRMERELDQIPEKATRKLLVKRFDVS